MGTNTNVHQKRVFKLVLTGGPCGGKTTGQVRLADFFETLGWKVYRVPETPTILIKAGVVYTDLDREEAFKFQENNLKLMFQLEDTLFDLAESSRKDCLVICDRGSMDPAAYIEAADWDSILAKSAHHLVDIRDNRYHQAWVGHPYLDVVTNEGITSFDDKILRLIKTVCSRANVETGDRLSRGSRKRKWLVKELTGPLPNQCQEFEVWHVYLESCDPDEHCRIRKRGQNDKWSYSSTKQRLIGGEWVETRRQISRIEYEDMKEHADGKRVPVQTRRRSFLFQNLYFQLDFYPAPLPPNCPVRGDLWILETFTTLDGPFAPHRLPSFLSIDKEITALPEFNMFNMALKSTN